jgi:hypothetical protein
MDTSDDCLEVIHQLVVPKSKNLKALRLEVGHPLSIEILLVEVLVTIQLDDQLLPRGAEIDKVGSDGGLTAEIDTAQAVGTQISPESGFRFGLVVAQDA